jgi:serine/threonine-protein kinase
MHLPVFVELQRRRVFRALIGYAIAAFAVLQIVEPVMHGLHWPDEVLSFVVVALAVGFPVVVSLAWIFDVNAGRVERTEPGASPGGLRGVRLVLVLVGIGVVAAAPGTAWFFLVRGIARPMSTSASAMENQTPSIAVLPFVNLSSDKEQEYFSDGIAEEILNALAQVEGLHVTGRTSSFYFKGKNEDLASIAAKLHVSTLLEGSVRKSGNHVRIRAQLINAKDGYHLWSKEYDRDLTDIFQVQGELAGAVVEALRVKLLPGTAPSSKVRPIRDPEAYRLFLLGRSLSGGTEESLRRSAAALEKAIALEPSYAPSWESLAGVRGSITLGAPRDEIQPRAREALDAAERAMTLDPASAGAYAVRGWIRAHLYWDWAGAQNDVERALALGSGTAIALSNYATVLQKPGRLKEAIATQQRVVEIEPLDSDAWSNLGNYLAQDDQFVAAREALNRSQEIAPDHEWAAKWLVQLDLLEAHPAKSLAAAEKLSSEVERLMFTSMAQHELGHPQESLRAMDALAAKADGPKGNVAYRVALVHAWRGEQDSAFEWLERAYVRRDLELRWLKIDPLLRKIRGDPRFDAFLRKMNLPVD